MNSPWFSNKGHVLQTLLGIVATLISAVVAWPAIRALDVFSTLPLIFYAFLMALGGYVAITWRSNKPQDRDHLGGIVRVYTAWAGMDNDDWLCKQNELYILLKDGKRFFEERSKALAERREDALYDRLVDNKKITHILIAHPNHHHIDAIATMDPFKAKEPELQTEECVAAIRTMQAMAADAKSRGTDITKRNTFSGYHNIPTYNAMLGDEKGHINLYYSRPYRGNLITLECTEREHGGIYNEYKNDLMEILRDKNTTSLWLFDLENSSR